ncbi:hypothetical protein KAS50_07940 [bacterium]|nr:hypothetical protein [bacterium]
MPKKSNRRKFLQRSFSLAAGAAVAGSFEEANLLAHATQQYEKIITSASKIPFEYAKIEDLKEQIPVTKIKNMSLSRIILGGNLIGGWAHARDLIYASKLVQAYNTKSKIWETLHIAEQCGVNTLLTNPKLCQVINEYWDKGYGKIQFISDCGGSDILTGIKKSIDHGATACYVHGAIADGLARKGNWDMMAKALELIKTNGLPAGIGAHSLNTVKGSVDHGLEPDFWMKTLNDVNYTCDTPQETIEFMRKVKEPWIAFKVLGAGVTKPRRGFKYAFENGADLLCIGMYDFQLVEDINIACDILSGDIQRKRPWRA